MNLSELKNEENRIKESIKESRIKIKALSIDIRHLEKQRQYDSLDALYNELFKDELNYIGIWTPSKIELNRRKIDSIFNELCNLKAELK